MSVDFRQIPSRSRDGNSANPSTIFNLWGTLQGRWPNFGHSDQWARCGRGPRVASYESASWTPNTRHLTAAERWTPMGNPGGPGSLGRSSISSTCTSTQRIAPQTVVPHIQRACFEWQDGEKEPFALPMSLLIHHSSSVWAFHHTVDLQMDNPVSQAKLECVLQTWR